MPPLLAGFQMRGRMSGKINRLHNLSRDFRSHIAILNKPNGLIIRTDVFAVVCYELCATYFIKICIIY